MRHLHSAEHNAFKIKMRLNAFVIGEIVNALYPDVSGDELRQAQNDVAVGIYGSNNLHRLIDELANAIKSEIDKPKPTSIASRVASRWLHKQS